MNHHEREYTCLNLRLTLWHHIWILIDGNWRLSIASKTSLICQTIHMNVAESGCHCSSAIHHLSISRHIFTMEPWWLRLCSVQTMLSPFESWLCLVCTPEWHQHLSLIVLKCSKQSGTLQIVSIHWRLIKLLIRIYPHETRFTTFKPNAERNATVWLGHKIQTEHYR